MNWDNGKMQDAVRGYLTQKRIFNTAEVGRVVRENSMPKERNPISESFMPDLYQVQAQPLSYPSLF